MLSDRINSLSQSATFAMAQKSAELSARGVDIINMSVGEPDFDTPAHIREAGKAAIDAGFTRYSPVSGYKDLRESICRRIESDHHVTYDPSQIVVSGGAKQSIANVMLALLNPGDEVIVPAPYWVTYTQAVILAGGVPVTVYSGMESGFKMTADRLAAAITDRTRLVILNSPGNPTGAVYGRDELESIAAVLRRHDGLLVLSDEIYEKITFCGPVTSISELPGMQDRTILIGGVSKAYAMTGWRIGYMAAPLWLAKGCATLQGQYTSGPCSISQKAALAALTSTQESTSTMCAEFRRRRDVILPLLAAIPGLETAEPDGAFYLFPRCSAFFGRTVRGHRITDATDFVMMLLEEAHVACVAGDSFGAPDHFRMSFALGEDRLEEAARRIRNLF